MKLRRLFFSVFLVAGLVAAYFWFRQPAGSDRTRRVIEFIRRPSAFAGWYMRAGQRCGDAPFQFPTDGYVGFLWDDSFRPGHRHQGIDIFGGGEPGETPVYAAHDGYLTRLSDWKSSLIVRLPQDPLRPDRQVWTYYTHLADADGNSFISLEFPPGSSEVFIKAGTLLGYQGNYSGDPRAPTGVHLHFSIVRDNGSGRWANELEIEQTIDPSPYFLLPLNAQTNRDEIPLCPGDTGSSSS